MSQAAGKSGKVLVIGLDGLDPEFLARHLEDLPVLNDLVEKGASGRLRSTIPPFSLTAWTSAMSGMNPARTGVTCIPADDFSDSIPPLNSLTVKVPRLWDVASANGLQVVAVNVPLTYPPTPVNGLMVSGFLTPGPDAEFTFPPALKNELAPGYRTSLDFFQHHSEPEEFLKHLYDLTEKQFHTVEYLLETKPWDLFIYVLSGTDWIQHYFSRDPDLPAWKESEAVMLKYFRRADDFLGRLRDRIGRSTSIIVLSDHGFGKVPSRYFYLNAWLEREGYLKFRRSPGGSLKSLLAGHLRSLGAVPFFAFLKPRLSFRLRAGFHKFTRLSRDQINWDETRASFGLFMHHTGYVRISPSVGSPEARKRLREEIISGLGELNESLAPDKVFSLICRKEDIFQGGDLTGIPDIFLLFQPDWLGQYVPSRKLVQKCPPGGRPGATHRMDGIYIFSGSSVRPGSRVNLEIFDIAPTVYSLLSLPLPAGTDGRPARECFLPEAGLQESVARRDYNYAPGVTTSWGRERQEKAVEKLRALGYL